MSLLAPNTSRPLEVLIYGGTDLKATPVGLARALAYDIIANTPATVVTGGFKSRARKPAAVSTDVAALDGAKLAAAERDEELARRFVARVPDPALDRRDDIGGVIRMTERDGITVTSTRGRTALGRRLALVGMVDLIVTVGGKQHTETILEQAIELGVPALPLEPTGGDSRTVYLANRPVIDSTFGAEVVASCFRVVRASLKSGEYAAADRAIVETLDEARFRRCLVLQRYDAANDERYRETIQPAVEEHMVAIRLKDAPSSELISTFFYQQAAAATTAIVDLTSPSSGVMYEVGYLHASGVEPLLVSTSPKARASLPVYFRDRSVHSPSSPAEWQALIAEHLANLRGRRARPGGDSVEERP